MSVLLIWQFIQPASQPHKSVTTTNCFQVKTQMWRVEHADELPCDGLCGNSAVVHTNCCISCWGRCSGKDAGCGGSELVWLHMFCEACWMYCKIYRDNWKQLLVVKRACRHGHSCSQYANGTLPQNPRHQCHCVLCCLISICHATPARWMDHPGKGEASTTDFNICAQTLTGIYPLIAWKKSSI